MPQGYEILASRDLSILIEEHQGRLLYQNKEDFSFVYQLGDQRMVWRPPIGSKGILFDNEAVMQEVLKHGVPIEDNSDPFKANQEHILDIGNEIGYWLQVLSERLDIMPDIHNDDLRYYKKINQKVNKVERDKRYMELAMPLGIFIGEKMRRGTDAQWKLKKRYGYRPYFEPFLEDSNAKAYLPWFKLGEHLNKRYFNLEKYLDTVKHFGR